MHFAIGFYGVNISHQRWSQRFEMH